MARVVVVGGGFAGTSAAARLAKLRHEVVLLEATDRLGGRLLGEQRAGGTWQLSPDTTTLPGVLRDLFRKSGRPLDRTLDLVTVPGRRHVFGDRTVLDLPMGRRSDQHDAVVEALGQDAWSPWVDTLPEVWDTLRRTTLDRLPDGPADLDRDARRAVGVRRSVSRLARKGLSDERLRAMVLDPVVLDGDDIRAAPGFVAVEHYLERNFGRWRVEGGLPVLAAALATRLEERRVEVRHGVVAHGLLMSDDQVTGVVTDHGEVAADLVIWCAPRWPDPLPQPRLLPAIPASRCLVLLDADAPVMPLDVAVHSEPPMRMWGDGTGRWTIAHHNPEDPLIALVRLGIDVRAHVLERHDLGPAELVTGRHWGWQWLRWTTMFDRPGVGGPSGLFMAGAHAHPGGTIEQIGMATASIAERVGPAPR